MVWNIKKGDIVNARFAVFSENRTEIGQYYCSGIVIDYNENKGTVEVKPRYKKVIVDARNASEIPERGEPSSPRPGGKIYIEQFERTMIDVVSEDIIQNKEFERTYAPLIEERERIKAKETAESCKFLFEID